MYQYCAHCGNKYSQPANSNKFACSSCGQVIYLNSKPTASALIVDGGRLLMGKRNSEPEKGKWDVIGGFLEYGERPEDGAKREAKEETGLDVEIVSCLGFFMDEYGPEKYSTLNICFVVKVVGGQPVPGDDVDELKWYAPDELPENIAFRNGREMVAAWLKSRLIK